jgi:hypothetical protein
VSKEQETFEDAFGEELWPIQDALKFDATPHSTVDVGTRTIVSPDGQFLQFGDPGHPENV